jgi:hypothetical protein
MKNSATRGKLLAVSSGGGHWIQLRRIVPAFEGFDVAYVTVVDAYRSQVAGHRFHRVNDATRWNKLGLMKLALHIAWIILMERPAVVVSTGALPGYFAVLFGRWSGARTVWLDSMANVDEMSMSGAQVGRYADLWLTQWPHLAKTVGPYYGGSVL